jgi:outer membrane murein-binding lipoprotein Lpp
VAGLLAVSVILSIFLSMGLTLATLLGINGTLDIGRSSAIQDLESQSGQLANQAQVLQGRLDAIDKRVQSLQGLTGRMSQVETQTSSLAEEVQVAKEDAQRLSQQVDNLAVTARSLEQRQSRQESVFQALADLLAPWASTSIPTMAPPSTPTPGG